MSSIPTPKKRARLDLPFVKRRRDAVWWIYHHRAGIFTLVILAFGMAILFIGYKVVIRTPGPENAVMIDLRTIEQMQQEIARLERETRLRQEFADGSPVSNAVSNEGAEWQDEALSSASGRADEVQGRMDASRNSWEQGLREIEAIDADRGKKGDEAGNDSRVKGRVLVSFSLVEPLRHRDNLITPGYRCEREGTVVVKIEVNRNGNVLKAEVDRVNSDNDPCMHSTALDAARRSRFNIDASAPERHTGTITYTFVAQ